MYICLYINTYYIYPFMHTCVCTYVLHVYLYIGRHAWTNRCIYVHYTHTYVLVHASMCMYICYIYIHTNESVCVCINEYEFMHMYVGRCVYMYSIHITYMHTYMHV